MKNAFLTFDFTLTIRETFGTEFPFGFVALHPFYKKIFSDNYNYLDKLELTYPLFERVLWETVANEIGFKSSTILAKALTWGNEVHFRELRDYVEYKNIELPDEQIPADIIIKVFQNLLAWQVNEVIGSFTDNTLEDEQLEDTYSFNENNFFDVAKKMLSYNYTLIKVPKVKIALLLPIIGLRDCYYTLILATEKTQLVDFIARIKVEGFYIDDSTSFKWWD